MFCEIGPATTCMTDYPERIAPKSTQKHRPKSAFLSEWIVSQAFMLAQCSQVSFPVPTNLEIRRNEG